MLLCLVLGRVRLQKKRSKDKSTDKYLWKLKDNKLIETVLMRYDEDGHRRKRRTICNPKHSLLEKICKSSFFFFYAHPHRTSSKLFQLIYYL
jgi:adenine C2-methylase RlmN of 23S rRNA A2503 and tRNA A37